MVDELKLAFEHPQERSKELLEINPLDRISLRNHIREVEIGAFHSERGAKQRIQFNIVVEVIIPTNPDDDVDLIFSYDTITSAIDNELSLGRINLLETLAERLASNILSDQRAVRAFIRIEKLDRGPGFLGVESARQGLGVTVSYWTDLESIRKWKANEAHMEAQKKGRDLWYKSYKTRIAKVERDYESIK